MNIYRNKLSNSIQAVIAAATLSISAAALAGEGHQQSWEGEMKDAWIDGKVETSFALNRYLNPFEIDTNVTNGRVILSGTVDSEIDRELAEEITKGIEGVVAVENRIKVEENANKDRQASNDDSKRDFDDIFDDATTTARVKFALLANEHTEGLSINVDTVSGVVFLNGKVESKEKRELAEQVAKNAEGVRDVENRLQVSNSS